MSVRALPLLLCVAVAGCQSANPYRAAHQAYPPAPADPTTVRRADPGSYPPDAVRDFAAYRHWAWAAPSEEPLAGMLSAELDQRGLRPATAQAPADLLLRASRQRSVRQEQVYDYPPGGYYGAYPGYWGAAGYPPRTVSYPVEEVRLEMLDPRSGARLWFGSGAAPLDGDDPRSADAALRRAVRQALGGFPPP